MRRPGVRTGRAAALIVAGLGCVLVAVGLGRLPSDRPSDPPGAPAGASAGASAGDPAPPAGKASPAPEWWLPASEAGWVSAEPPNSPGGRLHAGNIGGGARAYLRFEVPPPADPGRPAAESGQGTRLRLTGAGHPLPALLELVAVADTSWDSGSLSWQDAPALGRVVQSARPDPAGTVTFDVTGAVGWPARPGVYAFAVTVPPDLGYAAFAGADGNPGEPVLSLPYEPGTPPPSSPPAATSPAAPPDQALHPPRECTVDELLVPTCGALWGVSPDAHTNSPRTEALAEFEEKTGRQQAIYHAYHRGEALFPTEEEIEIAAGGRLLFLNWRPQPWSWAQVAAGHPEVNSYLDRLADHINRTFPQPFFLTVHHEPENDVRPSSGSGWQATDYAAMYRYVVEGLRDRGVDKVVTVMSYMAYVPWNTKPWFPDLYPGADVVDWIAWNTYAYSDPGYGYGGFAEMVNGRSSKYPDWPGFYNWSSEQFPDKPFMLGEWGVWYSKNNPGHMAEFYRSVVEQLPQYPRLKAVVYFDTPNDQRGRDSRPTVTEAGLAAFRRLGADPYFQVRIPDLAGSAGR